MRPLQLTLTGFIGIRDGLGRDQFTLDLAALAGDAPLVALVGRNGRGKSTILDNLTPYPVMASRAGLDGLGAFSYYDEVHLPESRKELLWEMDGRRYRSSIVIRPGSRKRTEAYLHEATPQGWQPVRLLDGMVADGRLDSYTRCVEAIAGPAGTFFCTAFAAQQRRHLCSYRHGEIKALLADLLGLHRVTALCERAQDTARLLRTGLAGLRQQLAALETQRQACAARTRPLDVLRGQVDLARQQRNMAGARLEHANGALAAVQAQQAQSARHETQRTQLLAERDAAQRDGAARLAELAKQARDEAARRVTLDEERARRAAAREAQHASLRAQQSHLRQLADGAAAANLAARRLPLIAKVAERRVEIAREGQAQLERHRRVQARLAVTHTELAALERTAGQAVLHENGLRQRLRLTREVPCCGSDLQPRCQLLADARAAHQQLPAAQAELTRLAEQRQNLLRDIDAMEGELATCARVPALSALAAQLAERSHARWQVCASLAARAPDRVQATRLMLDVADRIRALATEAQRDCAGDAAARHAIDTRLAELDGQRQVEEQRLAATLARLDRLIEALPAQPDPAQWSAAQHRCAATRQAWREADAALQASLDALAEGAHLHRQIEAMAAEQVALNTRAAQVEQRLADWTLLAKGLGNDGIVALAIDDAGPALSHLTNGLLLACYGPRFTVAVRTQLATAKGDVKEGFEITVHDADSRAAKNLVKMSGGERLWIDACLTRAMALYLAGQAGTHSDTLFSDEADGAFDMQRKRQFMAMKREILRLGGYKQEIFISHTPELAGMADAVIDLDVFMPN